MNDTRPQWPQFDLRLFKSSGDQATIDAMLQAQQRAEGYLQQNLGTAQSDLASWLSGNPDPAGGGTIKGPTDKTPRTVGGGKVPGPTPYHPPKHRRPGPPGSEPGPVRSGPETLKQQPVIPLGGAGGKATADFGMPALDALKMHPGVMQALQGLGGGAMKPRRPIGPPGAAQGASPLAAALQGGMGANPAMGAIKGPPGSG